MRNMAFPRRRMLGASLAGAAALGLPGFLRAEALMPTPQQTAGPFYPLSYPDDSDNDLGSVEIWDSPKQDIVIQAWDGPICAKRCPVGENATALPWEEVRPRSQR